VKHIVQPLHIVQPHQNLKGSVCFATKIEDAGSNSSAGTIMLPVKDSLLWHDAIQINRSQFGMQTTCCS